TSGSRRRGIARRRGERYGERRGALRSREGGREARRPIVLAVRQLVDKGVIPSVPEHEPAGRRPAALMERVAELGVLGGLTAPELGGLGLDLVSSVMVLEELARGWSTVAGLVAAQVIAAHLIGRFARPSERARTVPA